MRGMERSLQSTFPRIQVALRRSMRDFQVSVSVSSPFFYSFARSRLDICFLPLVIITKFQSFFTFPALCLALFYLSLAEHALKCF